MIIYIVTAIDIALSALFAILNKYVWRGFAYFVLSLLLLLALIWGAWLIYKYFTSYRKEQDEEFERYKIEQINKLGITKEQFEENVKEHRKQYNKTLIKQKILKWALIALCFAIAASFISAIILYK